MFDPVKELVLASISTVATGFWCYFDPSAESRAALFITLAASVAAAFHLAYKLGVRSGSRLNPEQVGSPLTTKLDESQDGTREAVNHPGTLTKAMAEKIVEEGMPSAEAVARYLIESIDNINCDNIYEGLEEKVRNGLRDIVIYNVDQTTVIQSIINYSYLGSRPRKSIAKRHVTTGRKAFKLKADSFIKKVELFLSEMDRFREQAVPSLAPTGERATPNDTSSS